jgi:hypothetical protein
MLQLVLNVRDHRNDKVHLTLEDPNESRGGAARDVFCSAFLAALRRNDTCEIAIKSDPKEPVLGSDTVEDIRRFFFVVGDDGVVDPFSSLLYTQSS